jgi:hypothetical protein
VTAAREDTWTAGHDLVAHRVAEADPGLSAETITAAVYELGHPAALRELRRALSQSPDALRVGAPPVVGRLVTELRARGSVLPEPFCARCRRTNRPLVATGGGGVCAACRRRQLATACSSCGGIKPVAGRDDDGRALCARCAPRPKRPCSLCGRVRVIARRARGGRGDVCDVCFREPVATCRICRRDKPCHFVAEGRPICLSCSPRRKLACAHCGAIALPSVQWSEGPVCEPCYRAALSRRGTCVKCRRDRRLVYPPGPSAQLCAGCAGVPSLATCRSCGAEERPYAKGCCVRCVLAERARKLIDGSGGQLRAISSAITAAPNPYSALNWLRSAKSAAILGDIVSGTLPLNHEALDERSDTVAAEFLRHLLVANGVLEERDDALARLETWSAIRIAAVRCPYQRRLLRSYATWRVLRRARLRAAAAHRPRTPTAHSRNILTAAIAFLGFMEDRGRPFADCSQADIDAFLVEGGPSAHEARDFIEWAAERGLIGRFILTGQAGRPQAAGLDDDTRWSIVDQLLVDESLDLGDRVAGCLVLLYGQQLSRIVALTRTQVSSDDDGTRLGLGPTEIRVPEPLGELLTRLASPGRRRRGMGSPVDTPWLFTGLHPGRPLTASRLGERLRRLGIGTIKGRRGALMHLAKQLPAAVLAELLNLQPSTACHWVELAGGDWTRYAAEIARRADREL